MPAAALDASAPGTERSSTVTATPRRESSYAAAQPITPPPTITTLTGDFGFGSFLRLKAAFLN
jgi:hypothetical protein